MKKKKRKQANKHSFSFPLYWKSLLPTPSQLLYWLFEAYTGETQPWGGKKQNIWASLFVYPEKKYF